MDKHIMLLVTCLKWHHTLSIQPRRRPCRLKLPALPEILFRKRGHTETHTARRSDKEVVTSGSNAILSGSVYYDSH